MRKWSKREYCDRQNCVMFKNNHSLFRRSRFTRPLSVPKTEIVFERQKFAGAAQRVRERGYGPVKKFRLLS